MKIFELQNEDLGLDLKNDRDTEYTIVFGLKVKQ